VGVSKDYRHLGQCFAEYTVPIFKVGRLHVQPQKGRFIIWHSSFCIDANKVLSRKSTISKHAFQLSLTLKLSALLCTHTVQIKQISPGREVGTVTYAFHDPSQTLLITSRYFLIRICSHLLNCVKWDHFYLSAYHTHTHTVPSSEQNLRTSNNC
jgi:hypothetical protein